MKRILDFFKRQQDYELELSVIVITYNMRREAARTLHSLTRGYQQGIADLNYEVIVVDNGSSEPLGEEYVRSFGRNFSYYLIENAPPSPAYAINFGASKAKGKILAIMIDGAHILTPGILRYAMSAFKIYTKPVVATRYWFLGPGQQGVTIQQGYNKDEEDRLLESIKWPKDGYKLFDIGVFILADETSWTQRPFESNCLFVQKRLFHSIGGADERFDLPGGGFVNLDLYKRALEHRGTTLVSILGEATFHQLHGGTTTNIIPEKRVDLVQTYRDQYKKLRGRDFTVPNKPMQLLGHMPAGAKKKGAI